MRKAKPGATVAHTSISAPPCMGCQSIAELPPALFGRYPHLGGEKHCETIVLPKSNTMSGGGGGGGHGCEEVCALTREVIM